MKNRFSLISSELIGIVSCIFIIVGFIFYFFYWIQRPMFSITMIESALQNRSSAQFEEYVDLDSVYGKAFDDFVILALNDKEFGKDSKVPKKVYSILTLSIMRSIRMDTVSLLRDATLRGIEGKEILDVNQSSISDSKLRNLDMTVMFLYFLDEFVKENELSDLTAETVVLKEKNISTVDGQVTFINNASKKPFFLKFRMIKDSNARWIVKEILNLEELIQQVKVNPLKFERLLE